MLRSLCSLLALTALGCGSSPPPATAPAPTASAAPTSSPARGAPRAASEPMRSAWPFTTTTRALYADVGGLLATATFRELTRLLPQRVAGFSSEPPLQCLSELLPAVRELALGAEGKDAPLLLARIDPAAADTLGACAEASGAHRLEVGGNAARSWDLSGAMLAMTSAGVVAMGEPKQVLEAVRGRHSGADLASLSLQPSEYLVARMQLPDGGKPLRGTLLVNDERLRLAVEGDAPSDEEASKIEQAFAGREQALRTLDLGSEGAQQAFLARLAQSLHLTRSGKHIDASLDLPGSSTEQVRDIGMMSAIAIAGFRGYLSAAKQAEARNVIGHLAVSLKASWAEQGTGKGARRKLASYPPVPAKVSSGVKYQSSPADWKPWAPLRFSMEEPQYYQYEIVAARDGKSADIIARGDLDGDGKTSLFTIHVTMKTPDTLEVSPIVATDPGE